MADITRNKIIAGVIIAGLWSVLLTPFFVANGMLFPYITGKNFAFRIIAEVIFALWAFLAAVDAKYRPRLSPVALAVGSFVLVMALADIFAADPVKAVWGNYERMDGLVNLLHLGMYLFVAGAVLRTEKIWLWFFRSSVMASMAMVILAAREWLETGGDRVSATLGNPIYAAVYFLFNFFFALLLLHRAAVKSEDSPEPAKIFLTQWLTYLYPLAALACALGIWRTGTRGVILGLLAGLAVTSLTIAVVEKKNRLMRNLFIGTLLLLAALAAGFIANRNSTFVQNGGTLKRLADMSLTQVYGRTKLHLWSIALKGFRERPLLGWGQEGFADIFNKHYGAGIDSREQWFDRAHNVPLDVLAAGGLPGLSAYLFIFAAAVLVLVRKRNKFRPAETGLVAGLLAAYAFQSLFIFDHFISYLFLFVVLAYLDSRDTRGSAAGGGRLPASAANYVLAPVLAAALIAALWYCNIKPVKANLDLVKALDSLAGQEPDAAAALEHFRKVFSADTFGSAEAAQQLLSVVPAVNNFGGADGKVKEEFVELARAQLAAQLRRAPQDAKLRYQAGVFFDGLDQYEAALPHLQKAAALSPENLLILLELTKCCSYLGQYELALETAGRAYALNPEYSAAKKNYARALILNGQDTQAKALGRGAPDQR